MKKKWAKYYFLLGSVIAIVLALICSFAFVQSNVNQLEDKHTFESIYTETKIDFIIPSPSFTQISELESAGTGIKTVTPYYETATAVDVNGKKANGTTLLFPDVSKAGTTPYCASRITSGETAISAMTAVVDKDFANKNQCKIGDTVKISIGGTEMTFTVSAISVKNTYYENGSIALFLNEENASKLVGENVRFSAAYVEAADEAVCENYLKNDYKPLGRLKDKAEFASEDAYNQHVENFNNADWSKEITNCKENYATLSVKYANVDTSAKRNLVIAAALVLLAIVIFNAVLLKATDLTQMMREYLIKKGGTQRQIASFYNGGIVFNFVEFAGISFALYYLIISKAGVKMSDYLIHALVPILVAIATSVIMMVIANVAVKKMYTAKRR